MPSGDAFSCDNLAPLSPGNFFQGQDIPLTETVTLSITYLGMATSPRGILRVRLPEPTA